jgi:hypothetical protein
MAGLLRSLYLCYFSQPKCLRPLCRLLCKRGKESPVHKITEVGVGTAERALRLMELFPRSDESTYTGIDMFEARASADGPGLSLKEAHKKLSTTGMKIRLVPGDPNSALARSANTLTDQDLILIAADQDRASLARAWFYLPRMLHNSTLVFEEELVEGVSTWKPISPEEIARRAAAAKGKRAA